ncbi:MAG: hypothetical protein V3S46_00345 [Nitrospinota bacterium]
MKKKIIIAVVVAAVAVAGGTAYWLFMGGKSAPEDQAQAEQAAEDAPSETSEESKKDGEESAPEEDGKKGDDAEKKDKPKAREIITGDTLEELLAIDPEEPKPFSARRLEKAHQFVLKDLTKQKETELKQMDDETLMAVEKQKMGNSIEGWLNRTK